MRFKESLLTKSLLILGTQTKHNLSHVISEFVSFFTTDSLRMQMSLVISEVGGRLTTQQPRTGLVLRTAHITIATVN